MRPPTSNTTLSQYKLSQLHFKYMFTSIHCNDIHRNKINHEYNESFIPTFISLYTNSIVHVEFVYGVSNPSKLDSQTK